MNIKILGGEKNAARYRKKFILVINEYKNGNR